MNQINKSFKNFFKLRYNIGRTQFLINDLSNTWYWKLSYKQRKYLYILIHPIRYRLLLDLKKKDVKMNNVSLKPIAESKSIFVRIPKSAGRSLSNSFYGCLVGSHIKLRDYQLIYKENEFNSFLKYTVVRNPWDRVVSAYFFLKEGGVSGSDKMFSEKYLSNITSFEEFVINHLPKKHIRNYIHFQPIHQFLSIGNNIQLNHIGYFEKLQDEFFYLKKKLGVSETKNLETNNVTKSRNHKSYKNYYTKESRTIVSELYKKDITLFKYSFENNLKNEIC